MDVDGPTSGNDSEQNNEWSVGEAACIVKRVCGHKREEATGGCRKQQ
jgi:hypothetical protein